MCVHAHICMDVCESCVGCCVHMLACGVCVCTPSHVLQCACRGHRAISGVGPCFPPNLGQSLFVVPCFACQASRPSWWFFCLCLSFFHRSSGIADTSYCIWICVASGDLNSGPHTCAASTLLSHISSPSSDQEHLDPVFKLTIPAAAMFSLPHTPKSV